MLPRTRISGKMDMSGLSAGLARPGIDTRTWISMAVAMGDSVVDPTNGVFVDVMLLPTQEEYTARVAAAYAGKSFGLYAKVNSGDELLVAVPSGDAGAGCVVIARQWNGLHTPPATAQANPDDLVLVLEADANLSITTQGKGQVTIKSAATVTVDCPDTRLGDANPSDQAALATPTENRIAALEQSWATASAALNGASGAMVPPIVTFVPSATPVACTTVKVK